MVGRPSIHQSKRRRNNVTIRMRDHMKKQMVAQAELNGRSLSEEIEFRLEQSFLIEDVIVKTVTAMKEEP